MKPPITPIPLHWDWERDIPPAPGLVVGQMIYLSGQCAFDPGGKVVAPRDMIAQADRCFANIQDILGRVGASMTDIVKLTTYFTEPLSRERAEQYWDVRRRYFGDYRPASTGVQVASLILPELVVEIEAIACLPEQR
ncbi:enamine deaminase RidA [Rhizorhabdus wittichii DC-6]|uniref:Endoribonuclease L-PSP n=1 Tax=Rhizorhabdus wittichii (strain DSM 6014 / CCUG 31198 / JCM 15750 / NBRC 105917 / EY 4224 / RW1) TaxID=392499 RepID=A0A9J9H9W6_RHIWR|nr:Endoribonuclease L-PSP [Rhizorhabdus wittichii RW1]ARR55692.1 enamine deaminase RidA [Rhizorhabdus wittichii DC-6]